MGYLPVLLISAGNDQTELNENLMSLISLKSLDSRPLVLG